MAALADHANVSNTALVILQQKGYQLWYDRSSYTYYAEKDDWDFASNSPVGLLGVVAIFEAQHPATWKEYWWRISDPELYRHLPDSPTTAYTPVYKRSPSRK